ncbi:uncharacterized protein (DUF305 family) [Streptomyces sp. 3330]|uniref:DUF305 domain-containing protein n=1 Tax=Streptomyces sp. 3330 TaxID=2817755 RepID=UPI002862E856|nr:DUF305 domain-containing protein [Streptomyces sp. 3330]MDR6974132.1 uncharacterized protein (DUF305 family) [Streptomyces sp. 3330]
MRNTRTLTRRAVLAAASVTAALVLAACGGDGGGAGHAGGHRSASSSTSADATAGAHNAQDVSFAQGMIPHHLQALDMAELAADRASSAEVKDLASRIEKAQAPEIRTLGGWLTSWGEDVPTSSGSTAGSMPGMDHSAGSGMPGMPGMMDGSDMDALEKASGTKFDTLFLTMMIDHHEGAVAMATTERSKGAYGPATSLADDIVTAQTAEIARMDKLVGGS